MKKIWLIGKRDVANKIYYTLLVRVLAKIFCSEEKLKKEQEISAGILRFLVSVLVVNRNKESNLNISFTSAKLWS
ncbi:MAG: hypothetical protein ACTS78_04385 [Arsenophonus sp. NC-WZS1-MAG3]